MVFIHAYLSSNQLIHLWWLKLPTVVSVQSVGLYQWYCPECVIRDILSRILLLHIFRFFWYLVIVKDKDKYSLSNLVLIEYRSVINLLSVSDRTDIFYQFIQYILGYLIREYRRSWGFLNINIICQSDQQSVTYCCIVGKLSDDSIFGVSGIFWSIDIDQAYRCVIVVRY